MKKKLAVFFVLLAGTLWGCIGIFVRQYNEIGLSSMQTVAVRMVIAAVLFSLFVLIYKRSLFKIRLKDIWIFIGSGVISVGLFTYCYFSSIELSSLSVAAVLLYTAPAFVMLFSLIFFKEKMTIPKAISLVLAVLGCAMTTGVIGGTLNVTLAGFLFGLGSGICYALYSIFSRFALNRGYEPFTITLYTFLFSAIFCLCVTDIRPVVKVVFADWGSAGYALLFALVSCVLPYVFYTLGLKYIRSSTASIIATVEPVVATIIGAVVFSEPLNIPFGYLGVALVFLSVVLINIKIPTKTKQA
ncbi:EamA family transporter [uncultured Ruminococcus sp.]|uniref:DMT family transporter n=1 Tax=uncultured Ruminococcus sp. TaxID=165186 RepID=UPI0029309688|nr:EamA family transporter [uncultured Ruminococcus sp.]